MVLLNLVIDLVKSDTIPAYPPDPEGNQVFAIECQDGVEIGMVYANGQFKFPMDIPEVYKPTEGELLLMKSQAAMYEELQKSKLSQMKANADIYEAILSKGGNV